MIDYTEIVSILKKGRGKDFNLLKAAMLECGHWKNRPRGVPQKRITLDKNKQFTAVNMYGSNTHQVQPIFDEDIDSI